MSITRRQFLISGASAGVGLILPSYYDKVLSFVENHGEPLLEAPTGIIEDLYADLSFSDYQLNLGMPVTELPEMTWREVIERYCNFQVTPENLEVELGITVTDLDKPRSSAIVWLVSKVSCIDSIGQSQIHSLIKRCSSLFCGCFETYAKPSSSSYAKLVGLVSTQSSQ